MPAVGMSGRTSQEALWPQEGPSRPPTEPQAPCGSQAEETPSPPAPPRQETASGPMTGKPLRWVPPAPACPRQLTAGEE